MEKIKRLYYLDWLRIIALFMLLIYHIVIIFQPFASDINNIYFPENIDSLQKNWIPMELYNIFRLPLLFFISWMWVYFSMQRRNWKQLLQERTKKILVPLIFGTIVIVQIQLFIFDKYFENFSLNTSLFNTSHLWFLTNIYIYILIMLPLFFYFKKNPNNSLIIFLKKIINKFSFSIYLITLPFILESLIIPINQPYSLFAFTLHGYINGFFSFLLGFLFISLWKTFWYSVDKNKYKCLLIAFLLYLIRVMYFDFLWLHILTSIESISWLFAIFGFAYNFLNKPSRVLTYLNKSVLPIYIIHMIFLYLWASIILPFSINPWIKLIFMIAFVFICCFLFYEIIKRIRLFRLFFWMKNNEELK